MATKMLGRYIVADPVICHGQPTFCGTRILLSDVLEQLANGMTWEAIIEEWHGQLTKEAIAESIRTDHPASASVSPFYLLHP